MEIERKWLLDINDIPYNLNDYEHFDIEQSYISFHPTIRIRKISNINEYILTIKSASKDNGLSRLEYELNITEKEYEQLLLKKEGITLLKTRYRIPEDKYILEIDLFHGEYEGLAYMEVEFNNTDEAKEYVPPKFTRKELTGNPKFTNSALVLGKFDINDF